MRAGAGLGHQGTAGCGLTGEPASGQFRVERCFNLKHWRDLATRFDKRASIYRACLVLIATLLWLR